MSVIRRVRHPGAPETRYAMPLSHSHQFLCVPPSPLTMTVRRPGAAGLVTSQISWAALPDVLSRYTLLLSARGSVLPSHTRTICAPPASALPISPGMWDRYLGCFGSVTSRIDVPLCSCLPVSELRTKSP